MDILSPWILVILGLSVLSIYVMVVALKTIGRIADRVSKTNEQLLVLIAHQTGGHDAASALITSAREPQRDLPGISVKKETKKEKKKELKKEADKKALVYEFTVGV